MEQPQPLNPQEFHVLTRAQKRLVLATAVLACFTILPLFVYLYYNFAIYRPSQTDKEITYEVKSGVPVSEVAGELADLGAINSAFLFKMYLVLNSLQSGVQAGVYVIPAGTSTAQLATQLQHGENDKKITFVEGWRMEEYALAAAKAFKNVDYEEFVLAASKYEGYLFPDTYMFQAEATEEEMMKDLLENFDSKTKGILAPGNLERIGLTKEEVVILASIVEREVYKDEDRPTVAGILIKRFKSGGLLDADATVQYIKSTYYYCADNSYRVCPREEEAAGFEWWPRVLTKIDLGIESQYNTRKVAGLPPKAISNPSAAAIGAIVNYKPTDFNYYLTGKDGNTYYAKTLLEHNDNVARYLQG